MKPTFDSIAEETAYLADFVTDSRKARIEEVLSHRTRHIVVGLENIYQPQNASAVLRTADCFGIQETYSIESDHTFYISTRVTHGADKWVDTFRLNEEGADNTQRAIDHLRGAGYKIVSTTLSNYTHTLESVPVEDKFALFFGTEASGISDSLAEQSDYRMIIPMHGFTQSFNVSVSAAISLYRLTERMRNAGVSWKLSEQEKLELRHRWYKAITNL